MGDKVERLMLARSEVKPHFRKVNGKLIKVKSYKRLIPDASDFIKRGEAHKVSEEDFVKYHVTGYIEPNAYKRYEDGDFGFVHRERFDTLLDTREVNGQKVEIRLEIEPLKYAKKTKAAPPQERDRLYDEYVAEAKRLGTTPMNAGIDLGIDSEEYKRLKEFDKRWRDSGEDFVRDENGELTYLTPEEMRAEGYPEVDHTVAAFVGDRAIGYAGDEFGATGVYLAKEFQGHGLGTALLRTYLEKSGRLANGTQLGQMTPAGVRATRALHRQLVKDSRADTST